MRARCLSDGARGIVPGSARGAIPRRSSPLCRPWRRRLYATMTSPVQVSPFTIQVPDRVLSDLRARIRSTRWPPGAPGAEWGQGTDFEYLKHLLGYWADGFDWRAQERELNRFKHFRVEIDGVAIHFVHERARQGSGVPIILTHGWPSAFTELLPLVPLLTEPHAHGIDGPAFDLVIPSLPGYGFSGRPARANYRSVAALWHRLMRELGYERYGAGGGDFGAGVTTLMALDEPQPVIRIHLSNLELSPSTGEGSRARFFRHSLARAHAGPGRFGRAPAGRPNLQRPPLFGGSPAAGGGGASVRRPPLDADARRWALRAGRGARAAGPRHRDLLRGPVTRLSTRAGSARH